MADYDASIPHGFVSPLMKRNPTTGNTSPVTNSGDTGYIYTSWKKACQSAWWWVSVGGAHTVRLNRTWRHRAKRIFSNVCVQFKHRERTHSAINWLINYLGLCWNLLYVFYFDYTIFNQLMSWIPIEYIILLESNFCGYEIHVNFTTSQMRVSN